ELLLFASSLKRNELSDKDFHVLTNICELNMYEAEKFPWFAFATGLSRASGCKGLAKLARWDDRSKISLDYTLLPYLTALIDDDKIAPEDALALLRLSIPVELYSCNTEKFAKAIDSKDYPNHKQLVSELIHQFEANNPGVPMDSTVKTLASLAEKVLGKNSETTVYLAAAHEQFGKVRDENNANMNYRGQSDTRFLHPQKSKDKENRSTLKRLAARTTPNDEASMANAVDELNAVQHIYDLKGEFFANLRGKLAFPDRPQYIEIITRLENLDLYTKLGELEKCKEEWGKSSAALAGIYETLGILLVQRHTDDFVSFDQLSDYQLKHVSDLSGVPIATLALELIKIFASPDGCAPASAWLGLASIICDESDIGQGQSALSRLLNSGSAKLASSVADGEWKKGLYPSNDPTEVAAGLVWRMLGSPHSVDRWRAAHSVRCFARFERWKVVDALVARFPTKDAHPFQAPELSFYYMHARLWLLIALARIAPDHPQNIAQYHKVLINIVLDEDSPHVLMRHFAAQAILACVDSGNLTLSARSIERIRAIDLSPFPRLRKKLKEVGHGSFYQGRPKNVPEPKTKFHLDYDFDKYAVHGLSDVFGKPGWEVRDLMSEVVRGFDPNVTSMYETGGREVSSRNYLGSMTSRYHTYGQQLGWHSLFLVAGRLLRQYPVTDDSYLDDPWTDWLNRSLLTRKDGLWLSDGMDRPPLDTKINLLEKGEDGLVITGDKAKILRLIGADSDSALGREIVVEGSWSSPDKIRVYISSALIAPGKAKSSARTLVEEKPFFVQIQTYNEYEDEKEYLRNEKKDYVPWVVCPSSEVRLDEDDPLGASCAIMRPHFAENIATTFALRTDDPFNRIWKNSAGKPMAHSDAWGYQNKYEDEASCLGVRLMCSGELLRDVLTNRNEDLLVLVKLERYEKGIGSMDSKFSHTVAAVRIKRTLDFEFYKGAVNKLHQTK
ncbi:MAG: transcriptional regulator, partial [Actinobacteria bacterium]|nr:transcriptional regulator [Actinomycetota bacterium]